MEIHARSPVWLGTVGILIVAELLWRIRKGHGYDAKTAFASLGLVLGGLPFALLTSGVIGALLSWLWSVAPVHLPVADWRTWAAGFLAFQFSYYWFHRASHEIRWMWATHSVHHSAPQLTLLSSFRLGWTNLLSAGWLFYAPLVLAGFDPRLVAAMIAFNLQYQFFLHTEAVGRLGPLEWVLNTPAHHRVHHGSNDAYLDKNYGGVLIIFDRLFGTLAIETAENPVRYGLAHSKPTNNPLRIAFGEWIAMARDAFDGRRATPLHRVLFGAPSATQAQQFGKKDQDQ